MGDKEYQTSGASGYFGYFGSAAGTLVLGLVLGRVGRIGPLVTAMPYTSAQAIGEFGMLVFLAQAGTRAGSQISGAFSSGEWLRILSQCDQRRYAEHAAADHRIQQ